MKKIFSLVFFLLILSSFILGQEGFQIGQWKSYLPFRKGISLTQSDNEIFYSTGFGVVAVDKKELSPTFYTKINSLTGIGTDLIKYHKGLGTLIVTYEDSNIDLLTPDNLINLPFIKNADILGDKRIYDIYLDGNAAILSTGFGISKLRIDRAEFGFTTFTGIQINNVVRYNDFYYASSDEGIYRANALNENLEDFGNWELLDMEEGFPADYSTQSMAVFEDQLYLNIMDTIFRYDGTNLESFFSKDSLSIKFLSAEGQYLLAGMTCNLTGCRSTFFRLSADGTAEQFQDNCVSTPIYAIEDDEGKVWFADLSDQMRFTGSPEGDCFKFSYNSPHSANINQIAIFEDDIYIASGGIFPNQNYLWRADGFYFLKDNTWQIKNQFNSSKLSGLYDFYDIEIHPVTGVVYTSSFLDGLVEYDGTDFQVYNDTNSTLKTVIPGDATRSRVGGLDFDEDNNLWMCNHASPTPIAVLRNDGTWLSFSANVATKNFYQVEVDQNGYKWFLNGSSSEPVYVLDTGENLEDTSDDQFRIINTNNSELPNGSVRSIAVDLEGDVWIGTTEGPVVFECGSNVFDQNCRGTRRIVEQDGFNAYLLETEEIKTIAVDGANRKWFGTNNGVFVQSDDGEEQIAFYDVNNSPLFDNTVLDIAINPRTGEVLIGTASGLQSIFGEAIEGGDLNEPKIQVFPNPVRSEYTGPIVIKGLARDANVKITNINGELVYETTAQGGQAIWNGLDYNGRKPNTGVYLVFSDNTNLTTTTDAVVAKILFVQ